MGWIIFINSRIHIYPFQISAHSYSLKLFVFSGNICNLTRFFTDIDECELNLHDCLTKEDCINEFGTFSCYEPYPDETGSFEFAEKCQTGYEFNIEKLLCDGSYIQLCTK